MCTDVYDDDGHMCVALRSATNMRRGAVAAIHDLTPDMCQHNMTYKNTCMHNHFVCVYVHMCTICTLYVHYMYTSSRQMPYRARTRQSLLPNSAWCLCMCVCEWLCTGDKQRTLAHVRTHVHICYLRYRRYLHVGDSVNSIVPLQTETRMLDSHRSNKPNTAHRVCGIQMK